MDEPVIHSSSWTGPLQIDDRPTDTAAAVGTTWLPTGRERAEWAEPTAPMSPDVRRWGRLAGLLFLSPLVLLAAWYFAHASAPDELWSDHREWLIFWAIAVMCVFAREIYAGRPVNAGPRSAFLALVLSSTVGFASWYAYVAVTSHSGAVPSAPKRTFELYHSCGKNCGYYVHQRPDGTTVEGTWVGDAVPYGSTCTLVQRLNGDYGFSWIRVLDRSPPPEHEIIWPIRREDCFSSKPLATLRG